MTDEKREAGSWIGQQPDENTEAVRQGLEEDAERVAVSDNTATGPAEPGESPSPKGHREPGA